MNPAQKAQVALRGWFTWWSGLGGVGWLLGAIVTLVLVVSVAGFLSSTWLGLLAAGGGSLAARKRWPDVAAGHYLTSKKAALPAVIFASGASWQLAARAYCFSPPDLTSATVLGVVAAVSAAIAAAIFEGKIMKSIFDLVPADQQESLQDFVQAGDKSGAPRGQFADFSALDPGGVVDSIRGRVIGQDSIVEDVVRTAFRRARLRRSNKPVSVFLFVGATGAGKTELAKALATELFDGRLVRVDCNELSAPHNVARLVGAPPGYVGSDQGGQLCRDIGRIGTGVLLFDEIEKADPAVMKVIMNLMDEGRLTEQSTGNTYSATGFVIVLTSNAAAEGIARVVASVSDPQAQIAGVKDELKSAGFLPEVLARIDSIFPFAQLSRAAVTQIVGRFLIQFSNDAGVELVGVDAALLIDLVTRQEKLVDYGVREVVRLVENSVVDGLLSVRDAGHATASINVINGQIQVVPGA
jgi:DNA polymerase III delta prime subunit